MVVGGQRVGNSTYTGCRNCGAMDHYAYACTKKAKEVVIKEAIAAAHGEQWYEDSYDQFVDGVDYHQVGDWVAAEFEKQAKYTVQLQHTHEKAKAELKKKKEDGDSDHAVLPRPNLVGMQTTATQSTKRQANALGSSSAMQKPASSVPAAGHSSFSGSGTVPIDTPEGSNIPISSLASGSDGVLFSSYGSGSDSVLIPRPVSSSNAKAGPLLYGAHSGHRTKSASSGWAALTKVGEGFVPLPGFIRGIVIMGSVTLLFLLLGCGMLLSASLTPMNLDHLMGQPDWQLGTAFASSPVKHHFGAARNDTPSSTGRPSAAGSGVHEGAGLSLDPDPSWWGLAIGTAQHRPEGLSGGLEIGSHHSAGGGTVAEEGPEEPSQLSSVSSSRGTGLSLDPDPSWWGLAIGTVQHSPEGFSGGLEIGSHHSAGGGTVTEEGPEEPAQLSSVLSSRGTGLTSSPDPNWWSLAIGSLQRGLEGLSGGLAKAPIHLPVTAG